MLYLLQSQAQELHCSGVCHRLLEVGHEAFEEELQELLIGGSFAAGEVSWVLNDKRALFFFLALKLDLPLLFGLLDFLLEFGFQPDAELKPFHVHE